MLRVLFAAAALAVFGCCAPTVAAPLEAYGRLPSIESIDVSPDGSKLAVAISGNEQRLLLIRDLSDGATQTYGMGQAKLRGFEWLSAEHLIVTVSQTASIADIIAPRREYLMGFDLNLKTQKMQQLLKRMPGGSNTGSYIHNKDSDRVNASLNILIGRPEVRTVADEPTLFLKGITFPERQGVLTMFRADLKTGSPSIVEIGDRFTTDIVLDQDGAPVAKTSYEPDSGRWALRLRQASGWKENRVVQAKTDPPFMVGLGRDGHSVVIGEMADTGFVMREVSAEGVWGQPLEVRDVDGPIFDPDTHRLIGLYALAGDEDRYVFFDDRNQKAWDAVRAAFKGDRVRLESWSQDRKTIVVLVDSASQGPAYALVNMTTQKASWLGARYQKLATSDIAKVEPVRFTASDGLELTGYLTLPNGTAAKGLPLVVFPHGGPATRDRPGFDWWAQAMASRGYAVLQVNYRGSDGFGWSFTKAGFGEWGRKMQTDLSDGVRFLAAAGTIDPKRVCIVGGSYGGYAALAGATLDKGVYRCAASVSGPSDLRRFVEWSKTRNGADAFRYWTRFMGAEDVRDPSLAEISPAAHADAVTIPVLLVHGRDDTVVPLEQSRIMADALKKAGKPVEFVIQAGEDHWLSRAETRLQTLEAIVTFLEKNNPPS